MQSGEVKKWNYPGLSKSGCVSRVPGLLVPFEWNGRSKLILRRTASLSDAGTKRMERKGDGKFKKDYSQTTTPSNHRAHGHNA
jgi:hypothetical protein